MSAAGFKSAIPAIDRPQIYAFDRTASGIGRPLILTPSNSLFSNFSSYNDNLDEYSKLLKSNALVLTSKIKVSLIYFLFFRLRNFKFKLPDYEISLFQRAF